MCLQQNLEYQGWIISIIDYKMEEQELIQGAKKSKEKNVEPSRVKHLKESRLISSLVLTVILCKMK